MKGGLVGAVAPRRFNPNGENTKNGDQAIPSTDREIMPEAALSSININAISVKPICKNRLSVKKNQANTKQTKQEQTPIKVSDGNPTVVWNNAIFQSEEDEVWGARACSSSLSSEGPSQSVAEVSSNGMGTKGAGKKEIHSTIVIKKLPSSLPIQLAESNPEARSPDLESIASSTEVPIQMKQSAQPIKKVLFSTEIVDQIPVVGESGDHKDNIDSGIEEIEKEISRLTEKLERLKLQQAAKQKNQEAQFSETPKALSSPKKTGKVEEPQVPIVEEPKSSEKPRRGRIVSAKFLQWDSSKKEQKPFESSSKKGKGGISPKNQRRAASLGPAEHLRFSQISSIKGKGDEHCVQKSNPGSARKWLRGNDNTKSTDVMKRLSLSPITQHPIELKGSNLRPAGLGRSLSARKPASTPLKEFARSTQWFHPKKLFQASDAKKSINTNALSISSKPCPEQPLKPSPSLKNARFVASRYGQALTPSKEKAAKNPQSSLSSLKNAHGKRSFPEDEFEHVHNKIDNNSCKKRSSVASSPNVRNPQTDKTVFTPRSRTPGKSATRLELKKIGGKSTGTLARNGTRETNNQQKGTQNRSSVIQDNNPLESANQEINAPDATKTYVFSAGIKSPDTLEQNRMQLPRIRTMSSAAPSPRDSGCIKRAVDSIGKKSFFAPDDNITTNLTDKTCEREIGANIKHAFSFEDEEVEER